MNFFPDNLLVVVDFAANRQAVVKKTAEIVTARRSVIHLLHVVKSWNPFVSFELNPPFRGILKGDVVTYVKIMIQLEDWKKDLETACPGTPVLIHIRKAFNVNKTIVRTVNRLEPDLVILTRRPAKTLFPSIHSSIPRTLLRKLPCRVMLINSSSRGEDKYAQVNSQLPVFRGEN